MTCREHCGACCIAPSISSPIPGMPNGKPAGVRCIHLTPDLRCGIYQHPDRPAVCAGFPARRDVCGHTRADALARLANWELLTAPLAADRVLAACVAAQDEMNDGAPPVS